MASSSASSVSSSIMSGSINESPWASMSKGTQEGDDDGVTKKKQQRGGRRQQRQQQRQERGLSGAAGSGANAWTNEDDGGEPDFSGGGVPGSSESATAPASSAAALAATSRRYEDWDDGTWSTWILRCLSKTMLFLDGLFAIVVIPYASVALAQRRGGNSDGNDGDFDGGSDYAAVEGSTYLRGPGPGPGPGPGESQDPTQAHIFSDQGDTTQTQTQTVLAAMALVLASLLLLRAASGWYATSRLNLHFSSGNTVGHGDAGELGAISTCSIALGLRLPSWICPVLAAYLAVASLLSLLYKSDVRGYLENHHQQQEQIQYQHGDLLGSSFKSSLEEWFSSQWSSVRSLHDSALDDLMHALNRHYVPWVPLGLLLAAVLYEGALRWRLHVAVGRLYWYQWNLQDQRDIQTIRQRARFARGRRGRPWWWQSDSGGNLAGGVDGRDGDLSRSLLTSPSIDDGEQGLSMMSTGQGGAGPRMSPSSPSARTVEGGWLWWPFFGNDDDDFEIDFSSVQEEWASRSEADPYWWTREEGQSQPLTRQEAGDNDTGPGAGRRQPNNEQLQIDTSWVHDRATF